MPAEINSEKNIQPSSNSHTTSGLDLVSLTDSFQHAQKDFKDTEHKQGFLGRSFDWMKNNIGSSAESSSTAGRMWSHVLSSDTGSVAVQRKLDDGMSAIVHASSEQLNSNHSPEDAAIATKAATKAIDSVNKYESSQRQGVEALSDVLSVGSVLASHKLSILGSALVGSATKTVAKLADGAYSNPGDDIITGGMMGLALPAGRMAGSINHVMTGMVESSLPRTAVTSSLGQLANSAMHKIFSGPGRVAMSMATEGAVIGYTQDSANMFMQHRADGDDRPAALSKSFVHPLLTEATGLGMVAGGFGAIGRIASTPEFFPMRAVPADRVTGFANPELVNSIRTSGVKAAETEATDLTGKVVQLPKKAIALPRQVGAD